MPKRRAPPRQRSLCLGRPKTPPEKFLLRLGITLLRLGQTTVPVLFFLRLILEPVTLLLDLQWKIIRRKIGLIKDPNKRMKGSIQA